MCKLFFGFGINDKSKPSSVNGKLKKEYITWNKMLARCYSKKSNTSKPTYIDCIASENFQNYSYFYEWCQNQAGFFLDGWELDKDLIINGNKIYSENSCVFLPKEINNFLLKRARFRGDYPIGVSYHKPLNKFRAQISKGRLRIHLGYFDTTEEAFLVYKSEKERHAKELATKYKDSIDNRAYNALMSYVVDIND